MHLGPQNPLCGRLWTNRFVSGHVVGCTATASCSDCCYPTRWDDESMMKALLPLLVASHTRCTTSLSHCSSCSFAKWKSAIGLASLHTGVSLSLLHTTSTGHRIKGRSPECKIIFECECFSSLKDTNFQNMFLYILTWVLERGQEFISCHFMITNSLIGQHLVSIRSNL